MARLTANLLALLLLSQLTSVTGCTSEAEPVTAETVLASHRTTLSVGHMTCASCSVTVKLVLRDRAGVVSVEIDARRGKVVVVHDDARVSSQQVADVISGAGFPATVDSTEGV